MKPRLRNALFGVVCVAQLAVPLSLVLKHEQTRSGGTPWRFQTAPVDPADPFRGKYVRLSFQAEREAVPMADTAVAFVPYDTRLYADLERGEDGFARLVRLHRRRPAAGEYLDVFVGRMEQDGAQPAAYVRLPFDRYYLPEHLAPAVEARYNEASRDQRAGTYVEVRVRAGHAALVDLVLGGESVSAGPD